MDKFEFLKGIVEPEILESYLKESETDNILKKSLDKIKDIPSLVNSVLAAAICISIREKYFTNQITSFLKVHPEISQAIQSKQLKDTMMKEILNESN